MSFYNLSHILWVIIYDSYECAIKIVVWKSVLWCSWNSELVITFTNCTLRLGFQNDSDSMVPATNQNGALNQSDRRSQTRLRPFLWWFCTGIVIWDTDRFKNEKIFISRIYSKTRFTIIKRFIRFATICAAGLRQLPGISSSTIEFRQIRIRKCPFWVVPTRTISWPVRGARVGWIGIWTTVVCRAGTSGPTVSMTRAVVVARLVVATTLVVTLVIIAPVRALFMCSIARLLALMLMIKSVTVRVCRTLGWTTLSMDGLKD